MKMNIERLKSFFMNQWEWGIPLVLAAVALTARLSLHYAYNYPMMIHEQDAVDYIGVANRILDVRPFFDVVRPPVYPAVIALFSLFPLDVESAARMGSMVMDSLVVIPLYWLGRRFLSPPGAAGAALLWALFSFALYFSVSPLSQSTFLFFLVWAVLLVLKGIEQPDSRSAIFLCSGLLFALSYLSRPEGIIPCGGAGIVLLLLAVRPNERLRMIKGMLSLGGGFLLIAGPYLLFLRFSLGFWAISGKVGAALKTPDGAITLNKSGHLDVPAKGLQAWQEHYGSLAGFADAVWENVKGFAAIGSATFPSWFFYLVVVGGLVLAFRKKWRVLLVLLLLPAATLPNYIVAIPRSHSYLYAVFPLLFLLFMVPIDAVVWGRLTDGLRRNRLVAAILATMILLPAIGMGYDGYQTANAAFRDPGIMEQALQTEKIYREAGLVLRSISLPGEKVVTRWGLIGYYADRLCVSLPKGNVAEVIQFGRDHGGNYLIIDTPAVYSRRQELMELLAPLEGKPVDPRYRLQIVHVALHPEIGGYVIYRYLP